MQSTLKARVSAEFIGTYIFIFTGTGAAITNSLTGSLGHIGVALTFGFALVALIYAFGHISGSHFNPAVTIAFWVMGEFDKKELLPYILAQILGGIVASVSLYLIFKENIHSLADVGYLGDSAPRGSWEQAFVLEIITTFILMTVICASAVHAKAVKSFAGIAIGFTVIIEAMFAGPISGASMNPARSIGPALVSGDLHNLWIYIVAPVIGAIVAVYVYKNTVGRMPSREIDKKNPQEALN